MNQKSTINLICIVSCVFAALFLAPILAEAQDYEDFTRLLADDDSALGERIPLILVHGTHGNRWKGEDGKDDNVDTPNLLYWKGIQDFFSANKQLRTEYKLYAFLV